MDIHVLHFESGGVLRWPAAETCGLTSTRIFYVYYVSPYRMSHSYPHRFTNYCHKAHFALSPY